MWCVCVETIVCMWCVLCGVLFVCTCGVVQLCVSCGRVVLCRVGVLSWTCGCVWCVWLLVCGCVWCSVWCVCGLVCVWNYTRRRAGHEHGRGRRERGSLSLYSFLSLLLSLLRSLPPLFLFSSLLFPSSSLLSSFLFPSRQQTLYKTRINQHGVQTSRCDLARASPH